MINRIRKMIKPLVVLAFVCMVFSCTNNALYFEYASVNENGWMKDSTCRYEISVNNTDELYNMYINTRNTGNYPYQNLWLFITEMGPDSVVKHDTINFYLADEFGMWLGKGVGHAYNMPVLYRQNFKFQQKGVYKFEIGQGMRDSMLLGISDVGIKVEKAN